MFEALLRRWRERREVERLAAIVEQAKAEQAERLTQAARDGGIYDHILERWVPHNGNR